MTTPLIEAMARALWIDMAQGIEDPALVWDAPEKTDHPLYWSQRMDDNRPRMKVSAQAALTAITTAGYAVVPIEPTEAMIEAGQETECEHGEMNCGAANAYRAMIHAGKAKG